MKTCSPTAPDVRRKETSPKSAVSLAVLFLAALILLFTIAASAEAEGEPSSPQRPAQPKAIWDYEKELMLTVEQSRMLKDALKELQQSFDEYGRKTERAEGELNAMADSGAEPGQLKAKLQEIASYQVEMRLADLLTVRKIHGILTAEQMEKWKTIQLREQGNGR